MLKSLYIRNYRIFKEFSIENLNRINLIVGKNNSGKSCLLEALYIYAQNASKFVLHSIIKNRGEEWEVMRQYLNNQHINKAESPFRHLFYGYKLPGLDTDPIEIGPLHNLEERIKLRVAAYQTIDNDGGRAFTKVDNIELVKDEFDEIELVIELESKGSFKRLIYLDRDYRRQISSVLRNDSNEIKFNVQFIPSSHFDSQQASNLWDNINIHPKLRSEVFKGLRLIDDRIQEIVKVSDSKDYTFILIYKDSEDRLPLNSMGDGINHLFHIILGLVNARGGILLIDEFENGLHYEVQQKIWELIYDLSDLLDVQIFATTHSRDTISALKQVAFKKSSEDETKFIKLKPIPKKEMIKPVELTFEKLKSILDQGIEVR